MTEKNKIRKLPLPSFAKTFKLAFLFATSTFILIPFYATFLGGFKSTGELRTQPFSLPEKWDLSHYQQILSDPSLWQMLGNSFLYTFLTISFTLLIASMVAFTFSHIHFFGKRFAYSYLISGMMFPAATAILSLFIKIRDFGLLDSTIGLVLPQIAFGLAMSVLFFKSFFEQLPKELFEAAMVDGCSYLRFFFQIIIPLSTPILATVGVFLLVSSWNSYILPLILLNSPDKYPWTLGLMQFRGQYNVEWNLVLGYITVTIIPAIVFFLLAQRYIVAGLSQGAVKG
ncbi:carbohydrate ABC transporter permease [Gynuella sp.]|uniref:carbohydrate ABC transporter permease n=1 Tax=Gynuella sp. TaxID=2969146 RepID=UPI003D13F7F2